jgi:uncharacterized repeat protein (TIGR03803 family)
MTRMQGFETTLPLWNNGRKSHGLWSKLRIAGALIVVCVVSASAAGAQTLNTIFTFDGTDGAFPAAPLVQGTDGNFYGTTLEGGTLGHGTVFTMTPEGQVTTLYNFCAQPFCPDGAYPGAGLVQGTDGNFYGTTTGPYGNIFKISSSGSLTTLHNFLNVGEGVAPHGLVQGTDGDFYGTTYQGGSNTGCFDGNEERCGTVFKITSEGVFTTLYSFCSQAGCTDGANPAAGLLLGTDGNFYGTTYVGGANGGATSGGTVFRITPAGPVTTLYSFCAQPGCADGQWPTGTLLLGTDGNFYGTTSEGGAGTIYPNTGTVFKLTPAGQLTTLYSFCSQSGCADGGLPNSGLLQGPDGDFYGTTSDDGAHGRGGTVFKISSRGQLTTLYTFCSKGVLPQPCADSGYPSADLIFGSNGKFYGTARGRVINHCLRDCGAIFSFGTGLDLIPSSAQVGKRVTITGLNLTGATSVTFNGVAATFTITSGTQIATTVPASATTGAVQVTTPGGLLTSNTVFLVKPHITSFKPVKGPVGTVVTIKGSTFSGVTQVTFGGVNATNFTVNSNTQLTAIVPTGAITGKISITTAGGMGTSAGTFTVTQ